MLKGELPWDWIVNACSRFITKKSELLEVKRNSSPLWQVKKFVKIFFEKFMNAEEVQLLLLSLREIYIIVLCPSFNWTKT